MGIYLASDLYQSWFGKCVRHGGGRFVNLLRRRFCAFRHAVANIHTEHMYWSAGRQPRYPVRRRVKFVPCWQPPRACTSPPYCAGCQTVESVRRITASYPYYSLFMHPGVSRRHRSACLSTQHTDAPSRRWDSVRAGAGTVAARPLLKGDRHE